ncbi:prepilin-type N-terminal cleavage/methylation domain-containing protein [Patescibacteria group bacterium]|nr:prepilin-type N-terminal cleavage/methylation domain-containing protein [Patescibacteria group bacterium]
MVKEKKAADDKKIGPRLISIFARFKKTAGFTRAPISGAGFTLVELIVVVSIFMMVFIFSYQGLRESRHIEEFRVAIEQVASDIRKAQTMALAGVSDQDMSSIAYGVYFDATTPAWEYVIFIDDNGDKNYGLEDDIIQTVELPEDIYLIGVEAGSEEIDDLAVVFKPPKPMIYINYVEGEEEHATESNITLFRSNVPGKMGVVNVNRITGRITAEVLEGGQALGNMLGGDGFKKPKKPKGK